MKIILTYVGVLLIIVFSFTALLSMSQSPEAKIVGDWKELTWEYERVDKIGDTINKEITENVKNIIGQDLLIHKAETWQFLPNGRLLLKAGDNQRIVTWKLKGRGHILQLKYEDDQITENYNLTEIDNNIMVLNFDSQIHARGIAKLTFERT